MLTGGAVLLLVVLIGLLALLLGVACHAWEMAGQALAKIERLERTVRLMARRRALDEAEAEVKAAAWWAAS